MRLISKIILGILAVGFSIGSYILVGTIMSNILDITFGEWMILNFFWGG